MTEQIENIKGMSLEKKEGQLVTGGIFYCRDSGYLSVSASNKLSYNLTVKCFETSLPTGRSATKTYRQTDSFCFQLGDSFFAGS